MSKLPDKDKNVVRHALLRLKKGITKRYQKDLSSLPGNGKSNSNDSSEAAEQALIEDLKDIDRILGHYTVSENYDKASTSSSPSHVTNTHMLSGQAFVDEPYLNPFTGQLVYPPSINTPGPSGTRQTLFHPSNPYSKHIEEDEDDVYRKVLHTAAISPNSRSSSENGSSSLSTFDTVSAHYQQGRLSSSTTIDQKPRSIYSPPSDEKTNIFQYVVSGIQNYIGIKSETEQQSVSINDSRIFPGKGKGKASISALDEVDIPYGVGSDIEAISNGYGHEEYNDEFSTVALDKRERAEYDRFAQIEGDRKFAAALQYSTITEVTQNDIDFLMAQNLAEDTPQNFDEFRGILTKAALQQQQQLSMLEHEFRQQEEAEAAETISHLQNMQDEWNQTWTESMRTQQTLAQQVAEIEQQNELANTLKEMRRLQEYFQAEENRQIEADRVLALSLSEDSSVIQSPSVPTSSMPFAALDNQPSRREEHSNEVVKQPGGPEALARERIAQPVNRLTADRDSNHLDKTTEVKLSLWDQSEAQWRAAIEANAEAARVAQREIDNLQMQARRDLDFAHQLQQQQKADEERQRQEQKRARQAAEAARKARMTECTVCSDEFDKDAVYRFPCNHNYCRNCLNLSVQNAVKSKSAFRCCNHRADLAAASRFLPPTLASQYTNVVLENDTPNPVYCAHNRCSTFIAPSNIKAGAATCPKCQKQTCASCKKPSHQGICSQDRDGQAFLRLSETKSWKKCPHCGNMVERNDGCLHMMCRCGRDFCYSCGKPSNKCSGTCKR